MLIDAIFHTIHCCILDYWLLLSRILVLQNAFNVLLLLYQIIIAAAICSIIYCCAHSSWVSNYAFLHPLFLCLHCFLISISCSISHHLLLHSLFLLLHSQFLLMHSRFFMAAFPNAYCCIHDNKLLHFLILLLHSRLYISAFPNINFRFSNWWLSLFLLFVYARWILD